MLQTLFLFSIWYAGLAAAAPSKLRPRSFSGITTDFADPSIHFDGDTWYCFASQSGHDNKNIHIQLAQSTDFKTWTYQSGWDVMPVLPAWASPKHQVWAPDINQLVCISLTLHLKATRLNSSLADGSWLIYFAAAPLLDPTKKCIGTARSRNIRGPYVPDAEPFDCSIPEGGSIDASGFLDTDGSRYVVWKIDANSLGHGGSCNNAVAPIVETPIVIQRVDVDGTTRIGERATLITNSVHDGPDVEAPQIRKVGSTYFLFFSSNCWATKWYDTSYAYSQSPMGGFVKATKPLLVTGDLGLTGPGGASLTLDAKKMVLASLQPDRRRFLFTTEVDFQEGQEQQVLIAG